jgi:hypothetical protein
MTVQRKNPRLSILGSFFMIIIAGTFYRISRINQKIVRSQVSSILEKLGNNLYSNTNFIKSKVLPSEVQLRNGEQAVIYSEVKKFRRIANIVRMLKRL